MQRNNRNRQHVAIFKINYKVITLLILMFLIMLWIKNLYQTNYYLNENNYILQLDIISKDKEIVELQKKIQKEKVVIQKPVEKQVKRVIKKPIILDTVTNINIINDTL